MVLSFPAKYTSMAPITLFVPSYVKKFLVKIYGTEPVYVRADHDLGMIFMMALSADNYLPVNEFVGEIANPTEAKESLEKIKIALSFRIKRQRLTHENYKRMQSVLVNEFEKAMYWYSVAMRTRRVSERQSVILFLQEFDIKFDGENAEIKFDRAHATVKRNRRQKETEQVVFGQKNI